MTRRAGDFNVGFRSGVSGRSAAPWRGDRALLKLLVEPGFGPSVEIPLRRVNALPCRFGPGWAGVAAGAWARGPGWRAQKSRAGAAEARFTAQAGETARLLRSSQV